MIPENKHLCPQCKIYGCCIPLDILSAFPPITLEQSFQFAVLSNMSAPVPSRGMNPGSVPSRRRNSPEESRPERAGPAQHRRTVGAATRPTQTPTANLPVRGRGAVAGAANTSTAATGGSPRHTSGVISSGGIQGGSSPERQTSSGTTSGSSAESSGDEEDLRNWTRELTDVPTPDNLQLLKSMIRVHQYARDKHRLQQTIHHEFAERLRQRLSARSHSTPPRHRNLARELQQEEEWEQDNTTKYRISACYVYDLKRLLAAGDEPASFRVFYDLWVSDCLTAAMTRYDMEPSSMPTPAPHLRASTPDWKQEMERDIRSRFTRESP